MRQRGWEQGSKRWSGKGETSHIRVWCEIITLQLYRGSMQANCITRTACVGVLCVCARVRACVCACVRACMRVEHHMAKKLDSAKSKP